jgi:hypothetical protein
MRYAAYLSPSKHGIFNFRLPIPPHLHPERKRTNMKVSLGTRCPKISVQLSQVLIKKSALCILVVNDPGLISNEGTSGHLLIQFVRLQQSICRHRYGLLGNEVQQSGDCSSRQRLSDAKPSFKDSTFECLTRECLIQLVQDACRLQVLSHKFALLSVSSSTLSRDMLASQFLAREALQEFLTTRSSLRNSHATVLRGYDPVLAKTKRFSVVLRLWRAVFVLRFHRGRPQRELTFASL